MWKHSGLLMTKTNWERIELEDYCKDRWINGREERSYNSIIKRKTIQFKLTKLFEQMLHQRKYTYDQSAHEKMLHIIIHLGNLTLTTNSIMYLL